MKHHTKNKGDLGVLKAQVDLAEQGYTVLLPLTEHAPFDLAIWKNNKFKTVQVKYRSAREGRLEVKMSTCWTDKNGIHTTPVNKNAIDLYCIYCPETGECYYFRPKDANKSMTLQIGTPKNNQEKGVNLASNFRRVP
jgi:hypothetical protein